MNFTNLLTYVTHHSESIIQWLFFAIMGLAAIVVGRQIFFKPTGGEISSGMGAMPLPDEIENMLKRILDQTAKLQSMPASTAINTEGVPADVLQQLELLKKDLQTREEEISRLQRSVSAGGATAAGDSKELVSRVKELEAKLEEYSILEDDIADLSLYKEENVRLKSDLEKLRAGGAVAASEPPAEPEPPAAEPVAVAPIPESVLPIPAAPVEAPPPAQPAGGGEDLVAEFAQAVNTNAAPSTGSPLDLPKTNDPMADFESSMKMEKQAQAPVPALPKEDEGHSSDLFAEFSQEEEAETSLDTDKMMEEMAALITTEAKDGSSSVLEENVDTDKMLEEANKFNKSS